MTNVTLRVLFQMFTGQHSGQTREHYTFYTEESRSGYVVLCGGLIDAVEFIQKQYQGSYVSVARLDEGTLLSTAIRDKHGLVAVIIVCIALEYGHLNKSDLIDSVIRRLGHESIPKTPWIEFKYNYDALHESSDEAGLSNILDII